MCPGGPSGSFPASCPLPPSHFSLAFTPEAFLRDGLAAPDWLFSYSLLQGLLTDPAGPPRTLRSHHALKELPWKQTHVSGVHWELSLLPGSSDFGPGRFTFSSVPLLLQPPLPRKALLPRHSLLEVTFHPHSPYMCTEQKRVGGVLPRSPGPFQVGPSLSHLC